ncbi:MAG: hypothetical protein ABI430_04970 [Candidatus Taylorbacteria bacterium]
MKKMIIVAIVALVIFGLPMWYIATHSQKQTTPTLETVATSPGVNDNGTEQTVIVGGNPTVDKNQVFARPSSDTNEVAKALADKSAKAKATLAAFNKAMTLNQTQAVQPASPTIPK